MGIHAAGDGTGLYDGHSHPFLRLRDGTHPLAVGSVDPGLLHRPGRSGRLRRWVPETGARPTGRFEGQRIGVSRLAGQAGTQAPDATPSPGPYGGSHARSTIHSLPADYAPIVADNFASPEGRRTASSGGPDLLRGWVEPTLPSAASVGADRAER